MKHLKYKLLSIPLGLILLALPVGAWALTQKECCPWGELLWTAFQVLPLAVALAVVALGVSFLLKRQNLDQ